MQLGKISLIASSVLLASTLYGENYVSVQYMSYDEDSGRTTIHTPAIEINRDFGMDYTLNLSFLHDSVSGASPIYYDASSGASATIPDGMIYKSDIVYGDVDYDEDRRAFGATLTKRLPSRDELTFGLNFSDEDDYESKEFSLEYLHYLDKSKNSSLSFGASYQRNKVGIYCFLNTDECDSASGASSDIKEKDLDVLTFEIGYTQVLDRKSQVKYSVFMIDEDGYLSNPYMRVVRDYYTDVKISADSKPDSRKALGFTMEYAKELRKNLSSISYYRFYDDDWGITSHTFSQRFYYEYDRWTFGLGFRGYTQSKADFFSGRRDYFTDQKYASSDRRVSEFDSYDYTFMTSYKVNSDLDINMAVGYYDQPEYLDARYYNFGFKYKF